MTKFIYLGCFSKEHYKSTCENAIKLIKFLDSEYQILNDAPCCGSLAYHVSSDEELRSHVKYVNTWFNDNNITNIVVICAGCYNYFNKYYNQFLEADFQVDTKHLLQFLNAPENLKKLNLKYSGEKLAVNYHDACHLRNAVKPIIEEPRNILNSIENIELKEMANNKFNSLCCGSGGGVYSSFKENSNYNSKSIFNQMKMTKALITACPFCYSALNRIRKENNIKKPVIKFEDFILNLLEGVDPIK